MSCVCGFAGTHTVQLSHLRKEFGSKVAVADMCLRIDAPCCFALLGENGAGKSTTISMIMGVFPPTSGTASVAGHDIREYVGLGLHEVVSLWTPNMMRVCAFGRNSDIDGVHMVTGLCPQVGDMVVCSWRAQPCTHTLCVASVA